MAKNSLRCALLLLAGPLSALSACGDDPAPPAPASPSVSAPAPAEPRPPAAAAVANPDGGSGASAAPKELVPTKPRIDPNLKGRERLLAEARIRPFKPEDLAANPPTNSDPFHSNMDVFLAKPVTNQTQQKITIDVAPEYNLEDLHLTMVIIDPQDSSKSRAMFIDPKGMGLAVTRGLRVGRLGALVKRIISDGVIFEFTEDIGQGKTRSSDRTVQLRPPEEKNR